ncbi:MAG: UDP-N-acetylglucosamine 2-epimerase (non-hydrolyzing) [Crocinitomicaceae bacterium]|nr:UDP-N-acetylglucosamine 2-epimerase (non-hydrolyzing) [Crocinitomicaceae bacterium]
MKTLVTVIGARPQIIKTAAVSHCLQQQFQRELKEIIVHTGQHYDHTMSNAFFQELDIPLPEFNLETGSLPPILRIAKTIEGLENIFTRVKPFAVLVYGDTDSTLAASLVADKMQLPLIHVEAGLRSFNKKMPEEINRIISDHSSTLLFCPTRAAIKNLEKEGFAIGNQPPFSADNPGIFHCGDVMYDNILRFCKISNDHSVILKKLELQGREYVLVTIHRDNNTDDHQRMSALLRAVIRIAEKQKINIVWPMHPRARKQMSHEILSGLFERLSSHPFIHLVEPVPYLDMIQLESNARLIMTDSGGVQKEAYFFKKPCVILRAQTEWVELVNNGNALIADADEENIAETFSHLFHKKDFSWPAFYGDGNAAAFICERIMELSMLC